MTAAFIALVAVLAGAIAVLRLHFAPTGLSPVRDAVSDYGITPWHALYRFQVVAFGASALLLLPALADAGGVRAGGRVWLATYGVARIAIAFFMTDGGVASRTREGRVHAALAALAFTAIAVAASTIGNDLGGGYSALGWIVVAAAVATLVAALLPRLRPGFGAAERALYAASVAWLAVVAIGFL